MDTKEYRKQIAEKFINSLKENPEHWHRGWSVAGLRPENCVSHTGYRGLNRFNLTYAAHLRGSDDMRWATFKQIQQMGWRLNKGAKSEVVEFWQPYDKLAHKTVSWDEYRCAEDKDNYSLLSRYYHVFNAKDISGIPPLEKVHNEINQNEAVDKIINGMNIKVFNDGRDRAYYSITNDTVHLPEKELFDNDYAYNSTLLHELSHATGAQTRLNRPQVGNMESLEYAVEELVAEISACFTSSDIGLEYQGEHFDNHKAYVQSWISRIEDKPEVLFDAIKQAEQASDYLLEKGGLLRTEQKAPANSVETENIKTPDKYLEEFDKDIKSNGYMMTQSLSNNYKALVESRNLDSPPSLEQISQEFLEGSTDNIVNAIGLELKVQEMERMEAMEACQ